MSRFDDLKEKLIIEKKEPYIDVFKPLVGAMIDLGWDSCAAEYEKLIAEKDAKLVKAVEALEFYASGWTMGFNGGELLVSVGTELNFEEVHTKARAALKEIEE